MSSAIVLVECKNDKKAETEKTETTDAKASVTIEKSEYGTTAKGEKVDSYKLKNQNGMEVDIITFGGRITDLKVPNKDGASENVVIGFDNLAQYEKEELADFIADNRLVVKQLLQTHCHLDHVFGAAYVKRKFGVKMLIHKNEIPILADVENRCRMWGIRGYEPVEADDFIDENDKIYLGAQGDFGFVIQLPNGQYQSHLWTHD